MIQRMPAFADLLKAIKNGYDEVLTETANQFQMQMQTAQDKLQKLNAENISLTRKNKQLAEMLRERDAKLEEQDRQLAFQ